MNSVLDIKNWTPEFRKMYINLLTGEVIANAPIARMVASWKPIKTKRRPNKRKNRNKVG